MVRISLRTRGRAGRTPLVVLAVLIVLFSAGTATRASGVPPVHATWLGPAGAGGDGSWTTAANWSTGVVPRNTGTVTYSVFIDGERPASSVVSYSGQDEIAHLTIGAGDGLRIPNGAWLTLAGDPSGAEPRLHNAGTIWLESTVGTTYLIVDNGTLSLFGGGTILFGAGDQNSITGSYRLNNLDNYIAGRGRIQTSLTNGGTVHANLAGDELRVLGNVTNSGTLAATSGGVLRFGSGITNTGTLLATPGSTLHLESGTFDNTGAALPIRVDSGTLHLGSVPWSGATLNGGVQLVAASTFHVTNATVTGTVDFMGTGTTILSYAHLAGATFLNSGAGLVRVTAGTANMGAFVNPVGGIVHVEDGGGLVLAGGRTFHNDGEIILDGVGTFTSVGVSFGTATLAGAGSVRLTDSAHNVIGGQSFGGAERLHNLGNTIHGRGRIRISFVNAGTIAANLPGRTLELEPGFGAMPLNTGTILAQNGGVVRFRSGSFDNAGGLVRVDSTDAPSSLLLEGGITGGTVELLGSGGTITLHNGYIVDGHLALGDGNVLRATQGGGLGGSIHIPATSAIDLDPSTSITVRAGSTFHNAGRVAVRGGAITVMNGALTLRGGGSVALINGARLQGTFGSSVSSLVNHDNLIHGGGTIWSFGQGIVNGPAATIRADAGAGSLSISQVFSTGTFLNQGTLAVPADAWLSLGLDARQASGLTLVDGRLSLDGPRLFTISGGTLAGSGTVEGFGRVVMEGGTLAPGGAAAGSIGNGFVVNGTLTLGAAATTAIDVAPDGEADAFGATYANLGGTLRVEAATGYQPVWLDEFLVAKWIQRTGRFARYEFDGAAPGFAFAPTYGASALTLTYARRGDANLDGAVNLEDFNALAANFGATGAEWSQADFDLDGVVNLRDFNLLAAHFGQSAASATLTPQDWAALAAAVPEPIVLPTLTCATLLTRPRGRFRRNA